MPIVFLSHASKDKPAVRRLAKDLRRAGIDVWLDEWHIRVGTPITQALQAGLDSADYVAIWLTSAAVRSQMVEREWQAKFHEELASGRVTVLPLLADDCSVPAFLRDKRYADFRTDYNVGLHELIDAIGGTTPISVEISIDFPRGVYWSAQGCPVAVKYKAHGLVGLRKIVVMQRAASEKRGIWHFQFESAITEGEDIVQGRVWFGSRLKGDQVSHELVAAVVPESYHFARHPGDARFDVNDYDFIEHRTVLRDDNVGPTGSTAPE